MIIIYHSIYKASAALLISPAGSYNGFLAKMNWNDLMISRTVLITYIYIMKMKLHPFFL